MRPYLRSEFIGKSAPGSLVVAESARPDPAAQEPAAEHPGGLDQQALPDLRALNAADEDGDRKIHLVLEGQPEARLAEEGGHQVQREKAAGEEVFDRVDDENEGRDLQQPEGE